MKSTVPVSKMENGEFTQVADQLAIEEPLQIQILYGSSGGERIKNIAVTMRTPGNDSELAAGFLYTEGIIAGMHEILHIVESASGTNTVMVVLRSDARPSLPDSDRNFYISSSCGVCGKASIDAVRNIRDYPSSTKNISVPASSLQSLPGKLRSEQLIFQSTGGLHACALFDTEGKLIALREDVGRHNALDKLAGYSLMNALIPLQQHILLLSGRASFELLHKAAMMGVKIVAAIGAPSSLAVELAEEAGITLIGFLKQDRFNIYTGRTSITQTLISV